MSASERLRGIGPPFDLAQTHSWIDAHNDGTTREINTMVTLYDALPEIVAVVEAAETSAREGWFQLIEGERLADALAALEETTR